MLHLTVLTCCTNPVHATGALHYACRKRDTRTMCWHDRPLAQLASAYRYNPVHAAMSNGPETNSGVSAG
jgi:hypothetical protein